MKKWMIFLFGLLLLAGCAQSYDGPTEEAWVLLGQEFVAVREGERVTTFRVENGYDMEGRLAVRRTTGESGTTSVTRYRYDAGELVSRETDYRLFLGFEIYKRHRDYTYDDQGRPLTEESHTPAFWNNETITYTYEPGKTIRTITDFFGNQLSVTEQYYDESGNPVRCVSENCEDISTYGETGLELTSESYRNGQWQSRHAYTYDDQGRIIRDICTTCYDDNPKVTQYEYDEEARTRTELRYPYRTVTEYDESGRETHSVTYEDGQLISERFYRYGHVQVARKEDAP